MQQVFVTSMFKSDHGKRILFFFFLPTLSLEMSVKYNINLI